VSLTRSASALFLFLSLSLAPAVPARAQDNDCGGPPSGVRLYVNVQQIRASTGLIAVTLYADNPRKFLAKRGALYVVRVPARAPATRVCINVPAAGVYGIAVYHDADSDRGFDRNAIGMPAEGYGFSNNPGTFFGLPSFSSVRLRVARTDMWTNVRLKYP
jgi:uncharacterized protein (DUF2141 family)